AADRVVGVGVVGHAGVAGAALGGRVAAGAKGLGRADGRLAVDREAVRVAVAVLGVGAGVAGREGPGVDAAVGGLAVGGAAAVHVGLVAVLHAVVAGRQGAGALRASVGAGADLVLAVVADLAAEAVAAGGAGGAAAVLVGLVGVLDAIGAVLGG